MSKPIRTTEQVLRATRKDLFYIDFPRPKKGTPAGFRMMRKWIKENIPGTETEIIGTSEYSEPFADKLLLRMRVDFDVDGHKAFCNRWETKDGFSIDKRFQCYHYPYEDWFKVKGHFVPTKAQPRRAAPTVWWYTPEGFIHHQSRGDARRPGFHPGSQHDIWFHVPRLWAELAALDTEKLTHGYVMGHPGDWSVYFTPPANPDPAFPQPSKEMIRRWFRLPRNSTVEVDEFPW